MNHLQLDAKQLIHLPFPLKTEVEIHHDNENGRYPTFCSIGCVIGAYLDLTQESSCQIMYNVQKINHPCVRDNDEKNNVLSCKRSDIRFVAGTFVNVKPNNNDIDGYSDRDNNLKYGIILGSVEIPMIMREYTNDKFWYSVYIISEDNMIHEILPDQVELCKEVREKGEKEECSYNDNEVDIRKDLRHDIGSNLSRGVAQNDECAVEMKHEHYDMHTHKEEDETHEQDSIKFKVESVFVDTNLHDKNNASVLSASDTSENNLVDHPYDVFMSNIPCPPMNRDQITKILSRYGDVKVGMILNGSAIVTFQNKSCAQKCIGEFHNQMILHRNGIPLSIVPGTKENGKYYYSTFYFLNVTIYVDIYFI